MKTFLSATLSIGLATAASAQTLLVQVKPVGSDLWGYADNKGEMVVPPTYKSCFRFTESGYAAVNDPATKQGGFINTKGERLKTEVSDFELIGGLFQTDVQGFACGLAPVKVSEKWGFMNTEGKLTVPAKYDKVDAFDGCHTVVEIAKKKYILSSDGKESPLADANVVDVKSFVDGLAPFVTADKKHGFMDGDQKVVIPAQFMGVGYFSDGLAWAKDAGKKVGFIDKSGKWVIEPKFDAATDFDPVSGMARVKSGDATFYVDKAGKEMRVSDATGMEAFRDGLAEGKRGDLIGFFDKTGTWVIEPKYQGARKFKNGHCAVKQGELWGILGAGAEVRCYQGYGVGEVIRTLFEAQRDFNSESRVLYPSAEASLQRPLHPALRIARWRRNEPLPRDPFEELDITIAHALHEGIVHRRYLLAFLAHEVVRDEPLAHELLA
ncbi:MAG: WG repeat-containing protein [Flavobacteriales bacterium]|nr:WG repeat-containing protein [Flavobacteriales bacterium]